MLTLLDRKPARTCAGSSRREFLKLGAAGMAATLASQLGGPLGLGTSPLLQSLMAAESGSQNQKLGGALRDKCVVLLFCQGGPSHIECFDPKMTAPAEFRSITGEVKTNLPGVTYGGTFPRMAAIADKLVTVRSYGSGNAGHTYEKVASGGNKTGAAMGAIYAKIAGTNNAASGMPTNTLILPEALEANLKLGSNFETSALPTLTQAGELGETYAAFNPAGGGVVTENMELRIEPERLTDRRALLAQLNQARRAVDATATANKSKTNDNKANDQWIEYQHQAFDVITGGVADAFDLSQEDAATVSRYDTRHLFKAEEVQRWGDMRRSSNLLGMQMLMARRLCEAGCRFITVSDCGWDMHSNGNSPKHLGGMYWLGPQLDHAVAAFVEDIFARGLQDKVLLIVTGEMGRTPRINNNGGRDHFGDLTPLVLAGGGFAGGQVIGESDAQITRAATDPLRPDNLFGTVMHTLFDVGKLRLQPSVPREIMREIEAAKPLPLS